MICTPQVKSSRHSRNNGDHEVNYCGDSETTQTFDRLSNDMSGFGPNHRENSDENGSSSGSDAEFAIAVRDGFDRASCATNGFDFYVNKLNNVQTGATIGAHRERNLFSPPFKTREEMENDKKNSQEAKKE